MTIVFYVGYYATPWGPEDLDTTGLGGTEKCVCFLAKELSAAGHDVHVLGQVRATNWNGVRFATGIDSPIDILIGVTEPFTQIDTKNVIHVGTSLTG